MAAYNRLNGQPCVASPLLLGEVLRKEWGFDGCVVSDCGGVDDVYQGHRVAASPQEAAALSVKGGCDLNCGNTYDYIPQAVREGLELSGDRREFVKDRSRQRNSDKEAHTRIMEPLNKSIL
jgi:beta-glucosidase